MALSRWRQEFTPRQWPLTTDDCLRRAQVFMMSAQTTDHTAERLIAYERLTSRRLTVALGVLVVVLVLVAAVSITIGSERIPLSTIVKVIAAHLTGSVTDVPFEQRIIIAEIRLPRVLMAMAVGAALSVAGAAYQ